MMVVGQRRRMYLFERAYVDYGHRLRRFRQRLWHFCLDIWGWFWRGPGATIIELLLRVAVFLVAGAACYFYVRYENSQGRSFSLSTAGAIIAIFVFAVLVLWGWKHPVHLLARALSGAAAFVTILSLSALAVAAAVVIFSVYLLILFALTALSFVIFVPMRLAHSLWLLRRRIAYRCPYDDDGLDHGLPIHICSCGQQYDDLQPSFYGIFYHVCDHGNKKVKLPTMDFLGRNKWPRLCRGCQRPLIFSSLGELPERPIAVVGGPDSGKSLFLRQSLRQLPQKLAILPQSTIEIDSQAQMNELKKDYALLDQGQVLAKTSGDVMHAFGVAVRIPERLRCLLYLYDAPGEHFLTLERFGRKQVVQHLQGIILLVDPYSLPALTRHRHKLNSEVKASATPFEQIVTVLIGGVSQMLVLQPAARCDVPLAVVLGKIDALPTQEFPFLADICPDVLPPWSQRQSQAYRQQLTHLGAEPSLRALEQKFAQVEYFACSALGRIPSWQDRTPFQPVGVTDPFLWLLGLTKASGSTRKLIVQR